jgi:hypothetical protein
MRRSVGQAVAATDEQVAPHCSPFWRSSLVRRSSTAGAQAIGGNSVARRIEQIVREVSDERTERHHGCGHDE